MPQHFLQIALSHLRAELGRVGEVPAKLASFISNEAKERSMAVAATLNVVGSLLQGENDPRARILTKRYHERVNLCGQLLYFLFKLFLGRHCSHLFLAEGLHGCAGAVEQTPAIEHVALSPVDVRAPHVHDQHLDVAGMEVAHDRGDIRAGT